MRWVWCLVATSALDVGHVSVGGNTAYRPDLRRRNVVWEIAAQCTYLDIDCSSVVSLVLISILNFNDDQIRNKSIHGY